MDVLTSFVLRHRRIVGLAWLVLLIAGGAASATLGSHLSQSFEIPGTPSDAAASAIIAHYHTGGSESPLVPVVRLPPGRTVNQPQVVSGLRAGFAAVAAAAPGGSRVASYANTASRSFVAADGRTTYGLIFTPTNGNPLDDPAISIARLREALLAHLPAGTQVQVTGISPLTAAGGSGKGPGVLGEILIGALGALAVLSFVFASFLAVVPLIIAAISINTAFLAILGLTYLTNINFVVQFLVGLIGLGVAIDYSLLLITRWREAMAQGHDNEAAIRQAMATAGRAIVFSGATVALGLVALIALPVPFIRGIGIGGMLIPLISVTVTLTVVPALLAGIGRRLDWPRLRQEKAHARGWTWWARLVVRCRWTAAAVALIILGALGAAALSLHVGDASVNSLSQRGQARQGVVLLERAGIPTGVLTPIEVYVPAGTSPAVVAATASDIQGIRGTVAPDSPAWRRNGTAMAAVLPTADGASAAGQATAAAVRRALARATPAALVGGTAVGIVDQVHSFYGQFPLVLAGLAIITFVLLARAFRSLILPLKAVLANLLSVGAAYGVLVLVWQDGYGSQAIWGLPATGAITAWIPLFVFAFLYGLSMDYEVFLLSRMREEYDRTGSTAQAVITGTGRTGRLITSAALILFLAMAALASAPFTFLKVFATGVGAGILLDATVVRSLLVPAIVSLFGRWNWWMPAWAAKILRVPPSPARPQSPGTIPAGEKAA
ncbi:MAG TPA: MMPL family transporter [Streptosporangiaceae bacterium]|nr:MMPL family transporter [Streptosporangiaceae bacterium]